MEYIINAEHELAQQSEVGKVAKTQLDPLARRGQIIEAAGPEIVDDAHAIAARDQRVHQVRADEAGAAGDERNGHV